MKGIKDRGRNKNRALGFGAGFGAHSDLHRSYDGIRSRMLGHERPGLGANGYGGIFRHFCVHPLSAQRGKRS